MSYIVLSMLNVEGNILQNSYCIMEVLGEM